MYFFKIKYPKPAGFLTNFGRVRVAGSGTRTRPMFRVPVTALPQTTVFKVGITLKLLSYNCHSYYYS